MKKKTVVSNSIDEYRKIIIDQAMEIRVLYNQLLSIRQEIDDIISVIDKRQNKRN